MVLDTPGRKIDLEKCNLEGLQDSGDPVRLGQKEPFRTQMYKEYKVNALTTAS